MSSLLVDIGADRSHVAARAKIERFRALRQFSNYPRPHFVYRPSTPYGVLMLIYQCNRSQSTSLSSNRRLEKLVTSSLRQSGWVTAGDEGYALQVEPQHRTTPCDHGWDGVSTGPLVYY